MAEDVRAVFWESGEVGAAEKNKDTDGIHVVGLDKVGGWVLNHVGYDRSLGVANVKGLTLKAFCAVAVLAAIFLCPGKAGAFQITDYYQAGSNMWTCASTTTIGVATQAGASVTNPPMILVNPNGSNVKLVVTEVGSDITTSPAAATGLFLAFNVVNSSAVAAPWSTGTVTSGMIGLSTGTYAMAMSTSAVGGPQTQAKCYTSGILPGTPVPFVMMGGTTGASSISPDNLLYRPYPPGSVVVPPGAILSIGASSATNLINHISWIEVRI